MNAPRRLRLGVLASGGGRTLLNLVERSRDGSLPGEVVLVVASRRGAPALDRARELGIPAVALSPRDFPGEAEFSAAVFGALEDAKVDLALLAGYLVKLPLKAGWRGRVMNIHPALLPKYGGRGFYGHHVHEAVLNGGETKSGCTVHFVDDEYDHGPVILQREVDVKPGDDADALGARVFEQEKIAYPEAVQLYAAGRLEIADGRVRIR